MNLQSETSRPTRLSVSRTKRAARRALTEDEMRILRLVADTLIPAAEGKLSGSAVKDFERLTGQALAILDARFDQLTAVMADLSPVSAADMWDRLREFNSVRADDFYWLSMVVVAAYLYSPEMKATLGYPTPHPNPYDLFEVAEELESGILDPVIERGEIYVRAD